MSIAGIFSMGGDCGHKGHDKGHDGKGHKGYSHGGYYGGKYDYKRSYGYYSGYNYHGKYRDYYKHGGISILGIRL